MTLSVLDAFREAVTAIKSRIYKRESLIFAKEIKQEDFSEYYLEKEIERELEQYLKEGNESKTGTTLDKLFKDIEKVLPIRIECMELLYSQIILIYRRTIRMGAPMQKLAEYFEIEEVLEKFPNQMSGGQKQRVAALRALLLHPQIVLADEPTGALDSRSARSLMEQLSGVNREDEAAVLMVTHDAQAASFCSRILFIQDGKVFHELRKRVGEETNREFYERILSVMAQLGGGSNYVL